MFVCKHFIECFLTICNCLIVNFQFSVFVGTRFIIFITKKRRPCIIQTTNFKQIEVNLSTLEAKVILKRHLLLLLAFYFILPANVYLWHLVQTNLIKPWNDRNNRKTKNQTTVSTSEFTDGSAWKGYPKCRIIYIKIYIVAKWWKIEQAMPFRCYVSLIMGRKGCCLCTDNGLPISFSVLLSRMARSLQEHAQSS